MDYFYRSGVTCTSVVSWFQKLLWVLEALSYIKKQLKVISPLLFILFCNKKLKYSAKFLKMVNKNFLGWHESYGQSARVSKQFLFFCFCFFCFVLFCFILFFFFFCLTSVWT